MSPALRGAYRMVAAAVRNELKKLDKQGAAGLVVNEEQRELLAAVADEAARRALGHTGTVADLFDDASRKVGH